jgi:hypothetical protein
VRNPGQCCRPQKRRSNVFTGLFRTSRGASPRGGGPPSSGRKERRASARRFDVF